MSCDMCVNNILAPINSRLLATYVKLDSRVRPLILTLKHFAHSRVINDPYDCTLSSYAYVLLAIHYLQNCSPSVLPCLQAINPPLNPPMVNGFNVYFCEDQATLKKYSSFNTKTAGELLCGLFSYYAHEFNFHDNVISVRTGGILTKESKNLVKKVGRDNTLLCIEDPFETTHNLGRIVHSKSLHIIRGEFMRAHRILVDNENVESLFTKPVYE